MFDSRSQPWRKELVMEIIARLREERQALVDRVAQIDKMLQQYEEWGREAQQLLSLTGAAKAESHLDHVAPAASTAVAESNEPEQPKFRQVGNERDRLRAPSLLPDVGRKTPMPEFEAAVIDVLRESGQPMDRVALYEALTTRGIVIGSGSRDRDLNALSARVYRMALDSSNGISGERGQGYRLITDEENPEPDSHDGGLVDDEDRDPLI
jgi:hypothetical protein